MIRIEGKMTDAQRKAAHAQAERKRRARIKAEKEAARIVQAPTDGSSNTGLVEIEDRPARQTPGMARLLANADAAKLRDQAVVEQEAALAEASKRRDDETTAELKAEVQQAKVDAKAAREAKKTAKAPKVAGQKTPRAGSDAEVILAQLTRPEGLTQATIETALTSLRSRPIKIAPFSTCKRFAIAYGLQLTETKDEDGTRRFYLIARKAA